MWQDLRRTAVSAVIVGCAALSFLGTTPSASPSAPPPAWGAFEYAWSSIAGYSTTIVAFEQMGAQVQNVVFDYTFHKPSSATVHVIAGPNAGGTLEWSGGDTVVAHRGSGFLAMFKKSFSLHDPVVTTIRGSSIDQLSFAAVLSHGENTQGTTSQAPGPVIWRRPDPSRSDGPHLRTRQRRVDARNRRPLVHDVHAGARTRIRRLYTRAPGRFLQHQAQYLRRRAVESVSSSPPTNCKTLEVLRDADEL